MLPDSHPRSDGFQPLSSYDTYVGNAPWILVTLKRFLAHMTQLLTAVPMSTRKVAMCAVHVLGGIIQALKTGDVVGLYDALEVAMTYLACHAQRAHPARDRQTGRSQLGLEPFFEHESMIEWVEAA